MALICPVCSAENREGAHFCKHCGGRLAPAAPGPIPAPGPDSRAAREWAATAPAQLRAPTMPGALFEEGGARVAFGTSSAFAAAGAGEQTVILEPGGARRPSREAREKRAAKRAASQPAEARKRRPKEKPLRARVLWLWLALLAVALVMMVAGWYGYGKGKPAEQAPVEQPAAVPLPPPAPPLAASSAPAAHVPPAAEVPAPAAAAEAEAPAPAPKPAPSARPRKPAPAAPAPAAAVAPAPAAAAAPAPAPAAPAAPAEPMALCGDRNFIARAQCMAAQCLKPEFKPHAQCEAVRRQQRLEEEKRNPTLIN